jgi:hypothetical protein
VLLILLGDLPFLLGRWHVWHWGPEQGTDLKVQIATYAKTDGWTILAIIGVTSLWLLPVIGRSARVRISFSLGGLALHALAMQTFYLDFMNRLPNPVDAFLGIVGVHGHEGGPLCFLVWAVPQIAGSKDAACKKELEELAGTWQLVASEKDGVSAPEADLKQTTVIITGDKYIMERAGRTVEEGWVCIDPARMPKVIDI